MSEYLENVDTVYVEEITGTIGEWLDKEILDAPQEVVDLLQKAYCLCVNA